MGTDFETIYQNLKPEEKIQIEFAFREEIIKIQEKVLEELDEFTPGVKSSFYSKPVDLADPNIEVHTLKAYRRSYIREKTFKKLFQQVIYAQQYVWPNLKQT